MAGINSRVDVVGSKRERRSRPRARRENQRAMMLNRAVAAVEQMEREADEHVALLQAGARVARALRD